jgi:CPA2 family monovalent cation:H+ antiporter-2
MHHDLMLLFLLLTAAVAGVMLARRMKLPTMLAYLAIGIAVGPHGFGLLQETEQAKTLAEFGIVFLMFSIGLEFSLQHLKAMRSLVLGFGAAQMLLTAGATGLVTWIGYGQDWKSGVAVGLAVAMSSTAIVARMLSERFELHSRSGRQTMGVLLFQDIAVVPCLILLPALAQPAGDLAQSLAIAAVEAVVLLYILIWVGQRLLRRLFDHIAHHRSEELFVLATLWVVVGLSYATGHAGMSLALGAFVGGMLISETPYRHQVEADIRPFRDILLGFFFITVGMMLDLAFVFEHFHKLILAVLLLIVGKAVVVMLICFAARNPIDTALRTSAQLAQAGEFGLVLIGLAGHLNLVEKDVFQVTLSAMLISMFIAPFLIERAARISGELS